MMPLKAWMIRRNWRKKLKRKWTKFFGKSHKVCLLFNAVATSGSVVGSVPCVVQKVAGSNPALAAT